MGRKRKDEWLAEPAAGNGILNRRIFMSALWSLGQPASGPAR